MTLTSQIPKILSNSDLSESSIQSIQNQLKFIDEIKSIKTKGIKKLNSKKTIMRELNKKYDKPRTIKTKIEAIKTLLLNHNGESKLRDFYVEQSNIIRKQVENIVNENKLTTKEKDNIVEWKDIVDIKDKLIKLDHKIIYQFIVEEKLFLRLAIFDIKLKNFDKDNDNYIKDDKLVMNDFKNVKSYGSQIFKLKKSTLDLINQVKGDKLFNLTIDQKKRFINNMFKKYLQKPINNNLLRKIYINEVMKDKLTNNEIKTKARRMLNSYDMWVKDYRKL